MARRRGPTGRPISPSRFSGRLIRHPPSPPRRSYFPSFPAASGFFRNKSLAFRDVSGPRGKMHEISPARRGAIRGPRHIEPFLGPGGNFPRRVKRGTNEETDLPPGAVFRQPNLVCPVVVALLFAQLPGGVGFFPNRPIGLYGGSLPKFMVFTFTFGERIARLQDNFR